MKPLSNILVEGITAGYFQWNTNYLPTEVRSYVRESLIYLVNVHAEVSNVDSVGCVNGRVGGVCEWEEGGMCEWEKSGEVSDGIADSIHND